MTEFLESIPSWIPITMGILVLAYTALSVRKHVSQGGDTGIIIDVFISGGVFVALVQILNGT